MGKLHEEHTVEDGASGLLHSTLDVGVHIIEVKDDDGNVVGRGTGATEAAARERAWKDVSQ